MFFRVLNYYHGGTANNVIDPTLERKWIYKKAQQIINSTLYVADAHSRPDNENSNISKLLDSIKGSNPSLYFLKIVNTSCGKKCETKFGFKPEGSVFKCHYYLLALKYIRQISLQMISVM